MLRVDELAVDVDVEDAAGTLDEERLHVERVFELGSQTGRLGLIVSLHAVGDAQVHSIWPGWNASGVSLF